MKELVIKLNGKITDSNFDRWKTALIKKINSANKPLSTDSDFAKAETTVKQFKIAEKTLAAAKASALKQAAEINKLFEAIDEVSEETRNARLALNKQIETRKEEIKQEMLALYGKEIKTLLREQSDDFKLVSPAVYSQSELVAAVKGKRTDKSMDTALNDLLDTIVIKIDNAASAIAINRERLKKVKSHRAIFQDEKNLLSMTTTELDATIKQRIATHEADALKRQQAEEQARRQAEEQATEPVVQPQPQPDQATPSAQRQPDSATKSSEPVEAYQLVVLIKAPLAAATHIANTVNNAIGNRDDVLQIRLRKIQGAA